MPSLLFASALQPATQLVKRLMTIRPKEAKLTIGLDIGSTSVKAVALGPRKGGPSRPIIAQHLVPIEEGKEADASDAVKTAISHLQVSLRTVNLAVSGQWVIMRIVEMPTMKPMEMKQALPFEAQRYLPFNIQDVVIDGVVLGPADANKSWVLIVACKKELIARRVDWAKRAGLEVALIDVDALALANGFLLNGNGHQPDVTHALINMGAQLSNLVIFKGDIPYLVRDIPWGGEKLTRTAAEQMGVEASVVKEQLLSNTQDPGLQNAMKLATEALVTELQLSFDYFENRFGQPPETLLASGGLSLSAAFIEALKSHITQSVTPWTPVRGLSGQFAIAYGLALRTI